MAREGRREGTAGHRAALLEAAKLLLTKKGFASVTTRELVAESGTNLASIGYHFGSKEGLLNAAVLDSMKDWGDQLDEALQGLGGAESMDQIRVLLNALADSYPSHQDTVVASTETMARASRVPEIRTALTAMHERARLDLAAMVLGVDPDAVDEEAARSVGSLVLAIFTGVSLQWLVDPANAPTGDDVARGIRTVVENPPGRPDRAPHQS